ncbi:MAG: DUF4139 domain-containing protein [Candidatus Micrarchaeota archaeon]
MKGILVFLLVCSLIIGAWADTTASDASSVEITVYQPPSNSNYYNPYSSYGNVQQVSRLTYEASTGIGLVKEIRNAVLSTGNQWMNYKNVASHILPTSVQIKDKTSPSQVLEQNYEFDLVSQTKLLEKYVEREITVVTDKGEINGTLLSYDNGIVLRNKDGITNIRDGIQQIKYPVLPEGLLTTPTLSWLLNAQQGGKHEFEVSYLTSGITWEADYIAVANKDDNRIDMTGWVTITNYAGATFKDAKLKLVAGDIHFVPRGGAKTLNAAAGYATSEVRYDAAPQFSEEGLFEYHLYTLQRPTTIKDSQIKQVSLFTSTGVPAEKELIFDGIRSAKVQVKLNINNSKTNGLGIPLPKGTVRIYKPDTSGQLQFLGEDAIDHTPENEQMRLYVGNAFDIVGQRKVMDHQGSYCNSRDTVQVQLRNHKKEDVVVTVIEHPSCDWDITEENFSHKKESTSEVQWKIPVKADSSATLTYVIKYSCGWC